MSTLLEKKLQGTDWRIGDAADFLQLSAEESALIDIRLSLAQAAKQSRVQHALSQTELAKRMKSSQSRIAKIEAADASLSIDWMVRALLASGAGRADVARALRWRRLSLLLRFNQEQFAAKFSYMALTMRHPDSSQKIIQYRRH
jgi:transcriptional regulator with XRE-family HTH domain